MDEKKKKELLEKVYIVIAIVLTVFVVSKLILDYSFCSTDDGYLHLIKIIGIKEIIKTGQFPPIIEPTFCNGYAINLFYNPLTSYLGVLFSTVLNNYIYGMKAMFILMIALSSIFMYMFLKDFTGKKEVAVVGAIFYITNPYYLSNIYIRGALGEAAALTFLPLLFIGLYNLFNNDRKKHFYIVISAVGLILTHSITTLYAAIISLLYVLINIMKLKDIDLIKKIGIDVIFIIGITLFFIYPLALHKTYGDYVILNNKEMGTYGEYVAKETLDIKDLFVKSKDNEIIFNYNIFQLILFIASLVCVKFVDKDRRKDYIMFFILTILLSIMTLTKSLWENMPDVFCNIQFPWRLLGFSGFFMSILASINLYMIAKKIFKEKALVFIIIPIALISLVYVYLQNYDVVLKKDYDSQRVAYTIRNLENIQYQNINREYLPVKTKWAIIKNPDAAYRTFSYVYQGDCEIVSEKKDNLRYEINLNYMNKYTKIEVPFLNYYGYRAYVEEESGHRISVKTEESEIGFVQITSPTDFDECKIVVEYKTPVIYYIVYIISFISFITFIVYLIYEKKKNKE